MLSLIHISDPTKDHDPSGTFAQISVASTVQTSNAVSYTHLDVYKRQHKFSNLLSVFCFYWVAIIFLASLELFEMIEVSSRTYFIIFIGGLGYIIGYFLSQNFRGVSIAIHNKRLTKIDFPKYEIRYKLAYIAMFIVCVFYLYSLIKIVLLLRDCLLYTSRCV